MSDQDRGLNHLGEAASSRPLIFRTAVEPSTGEPANRTTCVPIDVYETESYLIVTALIPGAKTDDLDATVDGDRLRLKGCLGESRTNEAERLTWHCHGIEPRRFDEIIALPVPVDLDRALATYGNGVLTVQFPKVDQVGPRRIPIRPHHSPAGLA